jgi:hypothetical protein
MIQAKWAICAGVLFLAVLAGCSAENTLGLNFFQQTASGQDRVVAVSPENEAESIQAVLSGLGLMANVNKNGDSIRISYTTKAGGHFGLLLVREKRGNQEFTRIHIDGDTGANDSSHQQVVAHLDAQKVQ